jgi:regulator of sigma E protease
MLQILVATIGLSLLVVVHEAGHYLMARAFGIRVTRFSIGFGPVLMKYQAKGSPTVFQVCAIPFLAYVMFMNSAEQDVDPSDPGLYTNKGALARTLTVFGGPFANYLAASVLIFFLALGGWRVDMPSEPMVIEAVEPGSPAARAGLRSGDVIIEANGKPIRNVEVLIDVLGPRAGVATWYVIERGGERLAPLQITARVREGHGTIGVSPRVDSRYQALPIGEAAQLAISLPWVVTVRNLEGMAGSIRKRSTEGIMGPVGMGKLVAQQADQGAYAFAWILVLISVALGLFNLLPLPGLDGGKLVFLGYELITRRRPNERVEVMVHTAGLVLLVSAIALVTLHDIVG